MYTLCSWDMKSQHSTQAIITDSAVPEILRIDANFAILSYASLFRLKLPYMYHACEAGLI